MTARVSLGVVLVGEVPVGVTRRARLPGRPSVALGVVLRDVEGRAVERDLRLLHLATSVVDAPVVQRSAHAESTLRVFV